MSLNHHLPLMRSVLKQLTEFGDDSPLSPAPSGDDVPCTRLLVAQGMENLIEHITLFDACLTEDTPFMKHFIGCLQGIRDDDTGAEQIFEDLVIFFREKALRLPPSRQTPVEREIMLQFEMSQTCEDPESLVRLWYWEFLPTLVQHDFLRALGLDRRPGKEYLHAVTGVCLNS